MYDVCNKPNVTTHKTYARARSKANNTFREFMNSAKETHKILILQSILIELQIDENLIKHAT